MAEEKRICMECGQSFRLSDMLKVGRKMYCKECSQEILNEKNNIESGSGIKIVNNNAQVSNYQESYSEKDRVPLKRNHTIAIILSVVFGWLGVDRFYVGHIGLGLLKMFTFGVYGIWWVIDIILFATKKIDNVIWE